VLFVCIGNACRSQMAEGFARAYGDDVVIAASAGLGPAMAVAADTIRAMDEKGIDLRHHFPKSLRNLSNARFDLVVNMSGCPLPPQLTIPAREWDVPDPVLASYDEHCRIRDRIELLVMSLILELRREQNRAAR
jgi:arsenate reductase